MKENNTCQIRISKKFVNYIDSIRGNLSRADMIDIVFKMYIEPRFNINIEIDN